MDMDLGKDMDTDMDMNSVYPETLVVVITSHGQIQVETTFDGKQEPDLFAIPYGMTLTRINAVTPGVCNYLSAKTAQIVVERVKEMTAKFDLTRGIPANLVTFLAKEFKQLTTVDRQKIRTKGYGAQDVSDVQAFDVHYDKAYKNITHNGYAFALNKTYSVEELSENYDDRIFFLNTPQGDIDFFTVLKPPYKTDLKSIVHYLKDHGVKNVLLVDLSCSTFDDTTLTPRGVRDLRRGLTHYKSGGVRKKKRKSNKRKSNKRKTNKRKSKCKIRRTRKLLHQTQHT